MSDLFGNHIVGFPTRRLICYSVQPGLCDLCLNWCQLCLNWYTVFFLLINCENPLQCKGKDSHILSKKHDCICLCGRHLLNKLRS